MKNSANFALEKLHCKPFEASGLKHLRHFQSGCGKLARASNPVHCSLFDANIAKYFYYIAPEVHVGSFILIKAEAIILPQLEQKWLLWLFR